MEIFIPALVLSLIGYGVSDYSTKDEVAVPTHIENATDGIRSKDYDDYIKRNAEEPILSTNKSAEPYANTSIINNPGFKPVVDNLYFFKNYYQLNIKQYKIEKDSVLAGANINLTIDSPKIINYQDGTQLAFKDTKLFDGIIIRAQLLPTSDGEHKFRLIYEIEATTAQLKKNSFAEKSGGSVINELVTGEVKAKESYQIIENGYNVYNDRVYSLDEKIIEVGKQNYIDIGPYRIEIKLDQSKKSDLYYSAKDIICKNKLCELMKNNTIKKSS